MPVELDEPGRNCSLEHVQVLELTFRNYRQSEPQGSSLILFFSIAFNFFTLLGDTFQSLKPYEAKLMLRVFSLIQRTVELQKEIRSKVGPFLLMFIDHPSAHGCKFDVLL